MYDDRNDKVGRPFPLFRVALDPELAEVVPLGDEDAENAGGYVRAFTEMGPVTFTGVLIPGVGFAALDRDAPSSEPEDG